MERKAREALAARQYRALVDQLALQVTAGASLTGRLWACYSEALRELGRYQEALAAARQALNSEPHVVSWRIELGLALKGLGRDDEAERCFRDVLAADPNQAAAWNNLGILLFERGCFSEARACYERVLALRPHHLEALVNAGALLFELGELEQARDCCARAVELAPNMVAARRGLAVAERAFGNPREALAQLEYALTLAPEDAATALKMAGVLGDLGRFEEATSYGMAAAAHPGTAALALATLMQMRRMTSADDDLRARAEVLLAQPLPVRQIATLHFGLGKLYDDWSDFARAFSHFERANRAIQGLSPGYDSVADGSMLSTWGRATAGLVVEGCVGCQSARPVFVIGMPRSGTTLVARILTAHSQVAGGGELEFWNQAFLRHRQAVLAGRFGGDDARRLAEQYLAVLAAIDPAAVRVVDKMPGNFVHVGLMHAIFPHARFIHVQRHPVDTCLSIYFQNFSLQHRYATDRAHLVARYRHYQGLMRNWKALLPPDRLLDLNYEALVADQTTWTRRLLEFVGLPWESACLDFQLSAGAVQTASNWQVRQPMYRSSLERWRRYEPWLGPLRALLPEEAPAAPMLEQMREPARETAMPPVERLRFLHVGCGAQRQAQTTAGFNQPGWEEIRLDIDPFVQPDVVGSMLDMGAVGLKGPGLN